MPQYVTGYDSNLIQLDQVIFSTIFQEVYGNYLKWGFEEKDFLNILTVFEYILLMKSSPISKYFLSGIHTYDENSYRQLIEVLKGHEIQKIFKNMHYFLNIFHTDTSTLLTELKKYETYKQALKH